MSRTTLLSLAESIDFPNLAPLYARLGVEERRVTAMRKALAEVKRAPPDFILAEFVYAWGNNYASCHIGNLDVLLLALPKFAPKSRVIVLARKRELEYAERLRDTYPFHALLTMPADPSEIENLLKEK